MNLRLTYLNSIYIAVLLTNCSQSPGPIVWSATDIELIERPSAAAFPSLTQPEGTRSIIINGQEPIDVDWVRYEGTDGEVSFSVPSTWKPAKANDTDLLLTFDSTEGDFFTLLISDKNDEVPSARDYIKQLAKDAVLSPSSEYSLIDYDILLNTHREVFYIQMIGSEKQAERFFIVVTENADYIFDFTMRSSNEKPALAAALFNMVMHSFEINHISVMGAEAKLEVADIGYDNPFAQ